MPAPKPAASFYDEPAARLLKSRYSRVHERLEELPWTQDSITGAEHDAIEWLYWLASRNWRATVALLDLPWTQDSITETERDAIEWLYWLTEEDWRAVAEVVAEPFLKTLETEDVQAIREMSGRDSESYLNRLSASYPEVDRPLQGLAWPQPPFTESERDAIRGLYWLAGEDQGAAATVAAMPWVQDGITPAERAAIHHIYGLSRREKSFGVKVVSLPWVQDDITLIESRAIKYLDWLAGDNKKAAAEVLAMPWVQDADTDVEYDTFEWLRRLARNSEKSAAIAVAMPWVQDGITESERDALRELSRIAYDSDAAATALAAMPWFQDGITKREANSLGHLSGISGRNANAAAALIAMPFLESVKDRDMLALMSLDYIAARDASGFLELMSHPKIKDGITDEETKIVAVLGKATYQDAPGSAEVLLADTRVYIQERLIELPHTGETLLAVIGVQDPDTRSMDYFEHAVRSIERFMGEPFPINYLAMLYYNNKSNNASNPFTHLFFMGEDNELNREAHPGVIAHEAAHWYWRTKGDGFQYQVWISEGSADLLRIISEHERLGRPLDPVKPPCSHFDNISELERANPNRWLPSGERNPADLCYYRLGQRFFLSLYLALGDETFRAAYRTLYLRSQMGAPGDGCGRPHLNICRVEAAFKDGASAEVVRKVDEVIARWYGPRP